MSKVKQPVLILGQTGTGKSSSVGNRICNETGDEIKNGLDPKVTVILNVERQPLPISNYSDFLNINIPDLTKLEECLELLEEIDEIESEEEYEAYLKYRESEDGIDYTKIENVVLESLSETSRIIYERMVRLYDKWTAFDKYQFKMMEILDRLKALKVQVFIFGRTEEKIEGIKKMEYFKPHGQKLRYGEVEGQLTIVLYATKIFDDDGFHIDTILEYRSNNRNTAKAPPGMFRGKMSNNLQIVKDGINEFYNRRS